jgi:catechol 2,3-dioxygenase-like lactoylglutathione lyase family enzyme
MSRVQLALNVSDLDQAIEFYSKLFATGPAKVREGYANFAIAEPPLKLVLIAGGGEPGTLNHLGVEVMSTDEVGAAITRLQGEGLATTVEEQTSCCYAVQDKVWVHGPDAEPWEVYTVLADAPEMRKVVSEGEAECCAPAASAEPVALTAKACC